MLESVYACPGAVAFHSRVPSVSLSSFLLNAKYLLNLPLGKKVTVGWSEPKVDAEGRLDREMRGQMDKTQQEANATSTPILRVPFLLPLKAASLPTVSIFTSEKSPATPLTSYSHRPRADFRINTNKRVSALGECR